MLRGLRPLEVHFRRKAEVNFFPLEQHDRRRALLAGCVFREMCVKRTKCPRFAWEFAPPCNWGFARKFVRACGAGREERCDLFLVPQISF